MTNPTLFPMGNALIHVIAPLFHRSCHIIGDGTFHFRFTQGQKYYLPQILSTNNQNYISDRPPSLFLSKTSEYSSTASRSLDNNANIFWLGSRHDPRISPVSGLNPGLEKKIVITIENIPLIGDCNKVGKMLSTCSRELCPILRARTRSRYRVMHDTSPSGMGKISVFYKDLGRELG